jgi:LPXTG-site transpeptidase (sortase) family protein
MSRRNLLLGGAALLVIWVITFLATSLLLNRAEEAEVQGLPSPTQRPIRSDIADLSQVTFTPSPTATPEATEEASPTDSAPEATASPIPPTGTSTPRPTAAFTLSALQIQRFQSQQQEAFNEEWYAKAQQTIEIPKTNEGAYPIRMSIEELGILSSVVVVQTDPQFDIVTPRDDVGFYALTDKIGAGGNSVMVGHVYPGRVFNRLLEAQVGQIVRITDEHYEEHYYRIQEIIRFPYEVGDEDDRALGFQYMYDDSEERLTLVTCYPEYEWTHRFVVRAVPLTEEEIEALEQTGG